MTMVALHLRQRIFANRSETFSSAIEYLAAHAGQEIFTLGLAVWLSSLGLSSRKVRSCSMFGLILDAGSVAMSRQAPPVETGPFLPSLSGFASALFTLIRNLGPAPRESLGCRFFAIEK